MAFMKMLLAILFSTVIPSVKADILGTAYEPGSQSQKTLFTYRESLPIHPANYEIKGTYLGLDGAELVVEQLAVKEGQITQYALQHKQLKENGSMEVKDGKLNFSYTANGKTSTNTEEIPNKLVAGLSLRPFIEKHWDEIIKGESVSFRYAVLDRRETVGFKVFKSEEGKRGEIPTLTIKMKPTSFIIAAIVDPVVLVFSAQDRSLLEIAGRTLPKKAVDGGWENLDPEMVFRKENRS